MIEEAKTRDGEISESFIYTIRGPRNHLEVQKRKMKTKLQFALKRS